MAFGETVDASTAKVILKMLEAGMRKRVVAELAETSVSTVKRVRRHADDNSGALRDPKPGAGRTHDPRWHFGGIAGVANTALLDRVASRMDASSTHEEIYMEYVKWCPQPAPKPATVSEQLRKLDFSCKRLSSCNPDRNAARCAAWHARVSQLYSRRQLICIDEVGCSKKASNRNRGISKKGTPAVTHLNVLAGGRKFSGLGVFSQDGFVGMHVVDGAFNAESFLDAVDRVVLPQMQPYPGPRSVLLVDNCRIHSVNELVARVRAFGARVIFLEPYDPQHMPIEVGFRAMKRWIRKNRDMLKDRPVHEQMRLAARCVSVSEAHQAYEAAGF